MKKTILILTILFFSLVIHAQSLITVNMTKVEVADSVNANLIELMDYKDVTLKTYFDTLTDTHTSSDLVLLQPAFDSLAVLYGTTLTDSIWYGQKGVLFRLAINTMFQELYEVYDNPLTASFSMSTDTVCNGSDMIFTNTSTGIYGDVTYDWNFGTGTPSTASTAGPHTVTYSGLGNDTIILTITGTTTSIDTNYIFKSPIPSALISGTTTVTQGDASPNITLTGGSAFEPYTFYYNINSGITESVSTISGNSITVPQSTSTSGTYVYTILSVEDAKGCSQSQTGSATITVE